MDGIRYKIGHLLVLIQCIILNFQDALYDVLTDKKGFKTYLIVRKYIFLITVLRQADIQQFKNNKQKYRKVFEQYFVILRSVSNYLQINKFKCEKKQSYKMNFVLLRVWIGFSLNNIIMHTIEVQSVINILFLRQYRWVNSGAAVIGLAGKHTGPKWFNIFLTLSCLSS